MTEYIERKLALQAVNEFFHDPKVDLALNAVPAADVAPVVHAKWTEVTFSDRFNARYWEYLCSHCNNYANKKYKYCPNCNAKMDLEDNE